MTAAPPLSADLESGLRRLRLSAIRKLAPELLVTATIQRWKPEQLLAASSKPRSPRVMRPTLEAV
jgi:hypothetical protein